MNCDRFRRQLQEYLDADLPDSLFREMAEHEAVCASCHEKASLTMAGQEAADGPAARSFTKEDTVAALDSVLERTTGADCRYIEHRLADVLDEPLTSGIADRVAGHLASCASCRRMRDVLEELPDWYAALPRLAADSDFVPEVLRRTSRREPGFLEVLRELWRRPEAIWEASVACALVSVLLFGSVVPTYRDVAGRAQGAVSSLASLSGLEASGDTGAPVVLRRAEELAAQPAGALRDGWGRVRAWGTGASRWTELVGSDLRTRDYQGLLRDIRVVLEPLGLYPNPPDERQKENKSHE